MSRRGRRMLLASLLASDALAVCLGLAGAYWLTQPGGPGPLPAAYARAVALGLARSASALLYGIRSTDPATYVSVAAGVTIVGFLAAWLPARRAAHVNPQELMRE